MCTLSFLRLADGYSLMMNRDESPLRPKPEQIRQAVVEGSDGVGRRVIYPVDPTSQGTWIGANDRGVVLAVMNQRPKGYQLPAKTESRGRLIPEGLKAASAITALERIAALDLSATPPFKLLGFEEEGAPLSLRWDGQHLERKLYPDGALVLSSLDDLQPLREGQFDVMLNALEGKDAAEVLAAQEAFHLSEEPAPGPQAVWMTHELARTVSYTHLLVQPRQTLLRYLEREARENAEAPIEVRLARASSVP
jgi:hypothetical protein